MSKVSISKILFAKHLFVCPIFIAIICGCVGTVDKESLTSIDNTSTIIPTSTPINVKAILEKSAMMMSKVDSFSFTLEHEGGIGTWLGDLLLVTAEGKIESPDSMDIEAKLLLGSLPFQTRVVSKDQISYIQNPLTEKWEKMEQSLNPLAYFDPETGIKSLLSEIDSHSIGAESTEKQYEIHGEISAKSLAPFVGITVDEQISITLLINRTSNYLDMVNMYGRIQPSDSFDIIRKLTIYEHNTPPHIKLPEHD